MAINRRFLGLCAIIFISALLSSCVSAPVYEEKVVLPPTPLEEIEGARKTITHEVAPGETLWRIGKMYGVSVSDIAKANHLSDISKLEMGQKLVIPNAAKFCPLIPLYPSNKWKYIIIHHSATDIGTALAINRGHKRRGFIEGLGYQFLIDNGTLGKSDGQIEISPRWIKQQDGAHCKADGMNYKAIGICLVGNLSERRPSEEQMDSLCALVNTLRNYYHIPVKNIIGHGKVRGARTECPGNMFPWKEFYRKLETDKERLRTVKGRL